MATTVHVSGISHETSEKEVKDFFSFCGKITNLSITPVSSDANAAKSATVTFEKETAAKTALLLDNTQLGKSQVKVSSASTIDDVAAKAGTQAGTDGDGHITQEDKPKSRILAEYLAHGYNLSDQAITKAITIDQKGGYSSRFFGMLNTLDDKTKATDRAKTVDAKYNVTNKALGAWGGLNSYFEKAIGTPTGQRIHQFYLEGDKQVRDVHNEARRLADLKGGKNTSEYQSGTEGKTQCSCAGSDGTCGCAPGACDCAGCAKHNAEKQNEPITVQKTSGLTACACHSNTGTCGCQPGQCSCKGCGKSTAEHTSEIREAAQATGQKLPDGSV